MNNYEAEVRREARWAFMLSLYHAQELGCNQTILQRLLSDLHLPLSVAEIKVQLAYLAELGFCKIVSPFDGNFRAIITAKGQDLVNYDSECPPSIARPDRKWW
jgi:hypothetical protein